MKFHVCFYAVTNTFLPGNRSDEFSMLDVRLTLTVYSTFKEHIFILAHARCT